MSGRDKYGRFSFNGNRSYFEVQRVDQKVFDKLKTELAERWDESLPSQGQDKSDACDYFVQGVIAKALAADGLAHLAIDESKRFHLTCRVKACITALLDVLDVMSMPENMPGEGLK